MGRGRYGSASVDPRGPIPDGLEVLFSKMLTTSDSKEFRIVMPKLQCEQQLAKEMVAASTSAATILQVWAGPDLVYDEPEDRTPPPTLSADAPAAAGAPGAEAGTAAAAPAEAEPRPPPGFWPFRYRVSPCGKSFIHSLQDLKGYLQGARALEGDTVTLCRRRVDSHFALFLSRAPRSAVSAERPAKRSSAAVARSSFTEASDDEDADSIGPIACRQNKRVRTAPTTYEPGVGYDPNVPTPRPRSAAPKRSLPLFANARIRVGSEYQAWIPDVGAALLGAPAAAGDSARPVSPAGDRGGEVRDAVQADAEASGADDMFASWPAWRHDAFGLGLSVHGKDLSAIARALGVETRAAVQYYYFRKSHARAPSGPVADFVTERLPR